MSLHRTTIKKFALVIAFAIMIAGVASGIEKVNKVMMPAFFIMFLILGVRVMMLSGSGDGYRYLFYPDWSKLANPMTWVFALGQAFFSLSLAGSGTLVYGSYLNDREDVMTGARDVAIFNTLAALLAAVVIIPAVFAYGIEVSAGPPLLFITMPVVFKEMPGGALFAAIFFVAVLFAGVTSPPMLRRDAERGSGRSDRASLVFIADLAGGGPRAVDGNAGRAPKPARPSGASTDRGRGKPPDRAPAPAGRAEPDRGPETWVRDRNRQRRTSDRAPAPTDRRPVRPPDFPGWGSRSADYRLE